MRGTKVTGMVTWARSLECCIRRLPEVGLGLVLWGVAVVGLAQEPPAIPAGLTAEQFQQFREEAARQEAALRLMWAAASSEAEQDRVADVEVYAKGVAWALRYDTKFEPADVQLMKAALAKGAERLAALDQGELPWGGQLGRVVRGYRSRVDGSVQPFGLVVPRALQAGRPLRLDVVLHGSTRPVGISELRFMGRFQQEGGTGGISLDEPYLELHPLGRVENCYRWAGETDVFEAIEAVCRQYPIDRDRIVLRGMSMGASGTWHLGLKHPDRFVALGPYCGYVDTRRFSETPLESFVRVGDLPDHQELGLHMLDSVDYAANGSMVPAIACMGAKDVFFDAHVLMGQAYRREGLQLVNLISPDTGHAIDPVTMREQMRLIGAFADRGLERLPAHVRFVTWTLKYPRCHWVELQRLGKHYERAEFEARRLADGLIQVSRTTNITRFQLAPEVVLGERPRVRLGELEIDLAEHPRERPVVLELEGAKWQLAEVESVHSSGGKRPGLQGPIDDAFSAPFLCVRGTGTPWNPEMHAAAMATLDQFARDWSQYLRGDLRIVDDTAVTETDRQNFHLILFGDPGSQRLLAEALPGLPVKWTRETIEVDGARYPAANHLPVLIHPSPWGGSNGRYLVVNSGHTFHASEFAKLNYLLYPRLGDWAVLRFPALADQALEGTQFLSGTGGVVLRAGYFNEDWQFEPPAPAE
jgi:pimeloyl-ACP methyl ester carboxylesterase